MSAADRLPGELALITARAAQKVGGAGFRSPYLGQVATNTHVPNAFVSGFPQSQSRSAHFARDVISSLQIVVPNFYQNAGAGEGGPASTASCTAHIEYPKGTFTRVKFGGSNTGTVPAQGMLVSDPVTIAIPKDALFFVQIWKNCAGGIVYNGVVGTHSFADVGFAYGATVTDTTMSSTFVASADYTRAGTPCAIIARTDRVSVGIYGDSRGQGRNDTIDRKAWDEGNLARAIGPKCAYINFGASGETLNGWITGSANRASLAAYCSHGILQLGFNDVTTQVGSVVTTRTNAVRALLPAAQPVFLATLEPGSTSTDGWVTTANQTTGAYNTVRTQVNTTRRSLSGLTGFAGYFELADIVETTRDSGIWLAGYTTDGVHATPAAYLVQRDSGYVDPSFLG